MNWILLSPPPLSANPDTPQKKLERAPLVHSNIVREIPIYTSWRSTAELTTNINIAVTVTTIQGRCHSIPKFEFPNGLSWPGAGFQMGNLLYHHFRSADINVILFSY